MGFPTVKSSGSRGFGFFKCETTSTYFVKLSRQSSKNSIVDELMRLPLLSKASLALPSKNSLPGYTYALTPGASRICLN